MNKEIAAVLAVVVVGVGAYLLLGSRSATEGVDTVLQAPGTTTPVTSGENPAPGSTVHDLPVEPAAARARADLATRLNIPEGNIVILEVESQTWSDGCLGLGGPAESCIAALVPGFKVEMLARGETYTYRTDATGVAVRFESDTSKN